MLRRARVLLLSLVALLGACLPIPAPWQGEGTRVMVFGDSLTSAIQSDSALTNIVVSEGFAVSSSSLIGARTSDLEAVVPKIPAPGADILLIALGTNDMSVDPASGQTRVPLATALSNVSAAIGASGAGCSIVVTVAESRSWGQLDRTAPPFNAALRALPGVVVADWAQVSADHPEYFLPNDVHHSPAGVEAYRSLFLDAIDACALTLPG